MGLLCLVAACKKSDASKQSSSHVLTVQVTKINSPYINYLFIIDNYTQKINYPEITGKKDTTFTISVNPGDELTVEYNVDSIPPKGDGFIGHASLQFIYNSKGVGYASGGSGNVSINLPK